MAEEDAPTTEQTEPQDGAARPLSLLAKEQFGDLYKGEVADEPVVEEATEEAEEVEAAESGEEDSGEDAGEPSQEKGEGGEEPISSLSELIEHQEWDPEWVNNLKVPVKVDGKPAEASLSDVIASYQIKEAATSRLDEANAKAKSITKDLTEKQQALDGQFATAKALIESAEKLLEGDISNADLKKLREDDPAEYSARKADFEERRKVIEDMKREAVDSYQKTVSEQQEQMQEEFQQRLKAEQDALLSKLPEWRDAEKANTEKSQLSKYLMEQGFSEQDVTAASDHRLVLLARKAMLFDQGQSKVDAAKKKVAKVPKVMKPGAPKPQDQLNREKQQKLIQQLKTGSSVAEQMEAGVALLKAKRGG